jgi:hypothetical protein
MYWQRTILILLLLVVIAPVFGQGKRPDRYRKPGNLYRKTYQKGAFVLPPADTTSPRVPFVHFPFPLTKGVKRSTLGVTFVTTPSDITEEVRLRVPAGDYHLLYGLTDDLALTGRFTFQFLQNNLSVGLRRSFPIGGRFYGSVGADVGGWFGVLQLSAFNNRGVGLQGVPNVAIGFRSSRDLLVTLRGEADLSFFYRSRVGQTVVERGSILYNGVGATATLEQTFFGRRHVALGFRALYTDFHWQFWALYDTFDRKIFYPEAFVGFFL